MSIQAEVYCWIYLQNHDNQAEWRIPKVRGTGEGGVNESTVSVWEDEKPVIGDKACT